MAIPTRPKRGLQDIHTHAGRVRQAAIPYKAFMRLSCLEMEKFRREKERESAMVRVRNIDRRFREIDEEKADILKAMGIASSDNPDAVRTANPKVRSPQNTGAFRLKY